MPEHHVLPSSPIVYTFGGAAPVLRVADGDTVTARTWDARGRDEFERPLPPEYEPAADGFSYYRGNPCVGPIEVVGAEPGDVLAVQIEAIELNRDTAWSGMGPGMGSLTQQVPGRKLLLNEPLESKLYDWELDREAMVGRLPLPASSVGSVTIPLDPFLGSIGVAPRWGRVETTLTPGEFGGNMDCLETRAGTTLYLPVNVRGGLLCFGDVHAAQGDGELCGSALETTAEVTVTLSILPDWPISWPRLEDADWIMAAGSSRPLHEALALAQTELLDWLVNDYGYDRYDAWQVNSQAGRTVVGNIVDPNYTVVAKFPKRLLPGASQA